METRSDLVISAALATVRDAQPKIAVGAALNLRDYYNAAELLARELVRLIGAGELVPARIEIQGANLAEQVRQLRAVLRKSQGRIENESAEMGLFDDPLLTEIKAALAATEPKPTEDAK